VDLKERGVSVLRRDLPVPKSSEVFHAGVLSFAPLVPASVSGSVSFQKPSFGGYRTTVSGFESVKSTVVKSNLDVRLDSTLPL
jgi:hypothetical protein